MPHRSGTRGVRAVGLPSEPGRDDGARLGQLCPAHPSAQHSAPRVSAGESGEKSLARGVMCAAGSRDQGGRKSVGEAWGFLTMITFGFGYDPRW